MIEQKLQSNVQPRDVSMTSTCRPSMVYPYSTRALRFGSASSPCRRRLTGRSGLCDDTAAPPSRHDTPGIEARLAPRSSARSTLAERQLAFAAHDDIDAAVPGAPYASGARLGS